MIEILTFQKVKVIKENPELYMILLLHYDRLNDFNKIQELIKEDKKFKLNFIVEQLEFSSK